MKRLSAVFCALLLFCALAGVLAESNELAVSAPAEEIRPGRPAIVTIMSPADGVCSLYLQDESGERVCSVAENRPVTAGYNALYWNGTEAGLPVPAGGSFATRSGELWMPPSVSLFAFSSIFRTLKSHFLVRRRATPATAPRATATPASAWIVYVMTLGST